MTSENPIPLTPLQVQLGERVEQVLRSAGLSPLREELEYLAPVLSSERQRSLRFRAPGVEVWVHDDGCGFGVGSQSWYAELLEYPDPTSIGNALEQRLSSALKQLAHRAP